MSQQCNFSTRANGRHEVGMGTETAIEVSKLAKQMQSMQATMLSMQSFMTNQGSASHIQQRDGSGDMSFNGEGCVGFQKEVQAMGYQQRDRGGVFSQTYNPKWRQHPNLSYLNNNALNSDMLSQEVNKGFNNNQGFNNRGFYQGQGSGSGQANQWNRQENFNNQARQQQKEAVLSDGQSNPFQMDESMPPLEVEQPLMHDATQALDISFQPDQLDLTLQLRDSIAAKMWDDYINGLAPM
ncbi:hypothetical protein LWI29_002858 [Acer saccharum]|uniref:Uncharacterized protein n=1 Tax=Acer saccharum TaxID=4024 RepID=A0AA39T425_ACESA|nr:hypothetical protein LWI29_002858 [Acer saccharum]